MKLAGSTPRIPARGWRAARWSLGGLLAAALTLAAVGRSVLPDMILRKDRSERWKLYHGRTPADLGLRADDLWLETEPGLCLRGWFTQPEKALARGTVVLLHGSSSCKESMLGLSKLIVGRGFNCLLYDGRAHGERGGIYCTYGFYESRDFSNFVDEIIRRYGAGVVGPVAVFGNSLGGAVALQAMDRDERIRCGVVESTFATLREIVPDYLEHYSGLRLPFVAGLALNRAGTLAHFPVAEVNPEQAASRIRRPVLLTHGTQDHWIDFRYGERIARHLRAPGSRFYPVPGADHDGLWKLGGDAYERTVLDFLSENCR